MQNSSNRIEWLDISKGIGIILVVLAHILLVGQGNVYIYSFHMPLFFFLAGFVFKPYKYNDIKIFTYVRLKSIVVPYFLFSFASYLYWIFIERTISGGFYDPLTAFINIFTSQGAVGFLPFNTALWFLTCLFVVEIIFYIIERTKRFVPIFLVVSSILGYMMYLYIPVKLPWGIDVAFTAIVFYGIGFIINTRKITFIKSKYICVFILCVALVAGFILSNINGYVYMAGNSFGNYFYFYIDAFLGIICVVIISMLIKTNNVLSYLGKNSLLILGLHIPIKRLIGMLTCNVLNISSSTLQSSFLISAIDMIIVIIVLLPFIYVINTIKYKNLGQQKMNKSPNAF